MQDQESAPANAELLVRSVRDMGVIRENPVILKRDCGFSTMYQGQSVWLFGDTLLETPNANNQILLGNSWSSTYDTDAGDGIEGFCECVDDVGAPAVFFPLTEEEKAFNTRYIGEVCEAEDCTAHWDIWPGTIVVDEDRDWAYIFYRKVLAESGLFKFIHVGHSIAVWRDIEASPERPVFNYVKSYPTLFFSEEGEHGFGSAAVVLGKEAYVYGCELGEDKLSKPCHVARIQLADILDKAAWTYYSGDGNWSPDIHASLKIFDGNDMMSVFFNPYVNRFIAIYSEPLGATAMLRYAPRPEGPWSEPMELFSVQAPENVYGWVYDFLAHPEFSQENSQTVYITYTKKTDKEHSQLRLVAVDLERSR